MNKKLAKKFFALSLVGISLLNTQSLTAFAEELQKNDGTLVMNDTTNHIEGLNASHMWSNDGGNSWSQGREGQLFRGTQEVRVAAFDQVVVDSSVWQVKSYPGGATVIYNGSVWRNAYWAEPSDRPGSASVWQKVKDLPTPLNIFKFNRFTGEEAERLQKEEAQRIQNEKKVIGYFSNWHGYKTDYEPDKPDYNYSQGIIDGKGYDPVDVPFDKITHVNYAFMVIDQNGELVSNDPWADFDDSHEGGGRNYINQITQLAEEHDVAAMVSIGGWTNSVDDHGFDHATATPERMDRFTTQLDAAVETYLEFGNAKNVEVVGFTRYPDRSRQGQTLGTIRVQEKLSNGNYIQMNYDVLFTVHQGLEATTMAQVLTLGETLDLEKAVNEVKYNNTVLARDAYEFEYDPRHDLDVPGRRYTMVTVVHKASGERIQVQVHLTIRWGETLLFRGEADRSAGALAYLPGENKIVARRGDNIGVAPIHPDFPELYYSLEVLRNTASQQSLDELSIKKNYEAAGSRGVNGHVSGIGTISIEYGDILKVYHAEAQERLRIFNNEIEGALSHKDNIAYLELTPTGYRQVLIDRVTPRTGLISQNMTDEQLAQQAASYLNLCNAPNVEVVGFTSYPDRSSLGQTTGTIQVQEKLSNGKYVQMAYEVPFTVEGTRTIYPEKNWEVAPNRRYEDGLSTKGWNHSYSIDIYRSKR